MYALSELAAACVHPAAEANKGRVDRLVNRTILSRVGGLRVKSDKTDSHRHSMPLAPYTLEAESPYSSARGPSGIPSGQLTDNPREESMPSQNVNKQTITTT